MSPLNDPGHGWPNRPTVADLQSDDNPPRTRGKQGSEGVDTVLLQFDSDLRRIIAAWGTLPDHLKRAMLALIE
jgi:hypothetical protein